MLRKKLTKNFLRGDSLVEVMFSVGIFGIIAVSAISLMNRGVNSAQTSLETAMARNEIDAQAEALRFIHDSYAAEINNETKEFAALWEKIKSRAVEAKDILSSAGYTAAYPKFLNYPSKITSCEYDSTNPDGSAYSDGSSKGIAIIDKSFALNTHKLDTTSVANPDNVIITTLRHSDTYSQIRYSDAGNLGSTNLSTNATSADGIWVTAVKPTSANPQYYDFYIRTCWNSPGQGNPTTISTIIRLYNPDY